MFFVAHHFTCWLNKQILGSQENVTSAEAAPASGGKVKESPPKPPRSAFMCYTDCKKKEIMALHGVLEENDSILKLVAREWRKLSGTLTFLVQLLLHEQKKTSLSFITV
jgi:hypothetical protein